MEGTLIKDRVCLYTNLDTTNFSSKFALQQMPNIEIVKIFGNWFF